VDALRQPPHRRHAVAADEDVGALRRDVAALAERRCAVRPGEASLVATELATNIVRHARSGGYVLYRPVGDGLELLAVDHGPGASVPGLPYWAIRPEGVRPPGGGLGVGLASVRRLATDFDCYSDPAGTVVLARLGTSAPQVAPWRWGGVNVPYDGVGESGDAWSVSPERRPAALVVDGLGHGFAAAAAARAAVAAFEQVPPGDVCGFVRRAHDAMRGTRGGVLAVCAIDPDQGELAFAGVGNIAGRVLVGGESHGLVGRHGSLGTQPDPPRCHAAAHRWRPGATLMLASDGIRIGWQSASRPALLSRDPAVAAAVLYRDHSRAGDDASILVVRDTRAAEGGDR
jgi:anti-sigma regulatory factor (Ser/Thr protein kinase)